MQSVCVSEERKIGGEIERVEISPSVGQTLGGDSQGVEAQCLHPVGQIGLEMRDHALGVERGDKYRPGA